MELNKFIQDNYIALYKVAKYKHNKYPTELVSELYLILKKDWNKYESLSQNEMMKISNRIMMNQLQWQTSSFNKNNKIDNEEYTDVINTHSYSINENVIDMPTEIRDLIESISDNSEKNIELLCKIELIKKDLNIFDIILFELYYTNNLSYRKIAKLKNIKESTMYLMVKKLNTRIKYLVNEL